VNLMPALGQMQQHAPGATAKFEDGATVLVGQFGIHHQVIGLVLMFGVIVAGDSFVEAHRVSVAG